MADKSQSPPPPPAATSTESSPPPAAVAKSTPQSAPKSPPAAVAASAPAGTSSSQAQAEEGSSTTSLTPAPATPAAPAATAPATTPATAPTTETNTGILPPETWAAAEAGDDADSSLGDLDNVSSTASLTASILEYRTYHGRTYHSDRGDAQYWGSNDARAAESMDINHHMLTLCLDGKLFRAPLDGDKIEKVLDVGTGTGIWAIDFADQYPNAEVIGTDLSPIQPTWVPPNLMFEIDDATQPWTFPADSFDYVHMRYLVGSIVDWTALYRQAFKALKPGGWLEDYEAAPFLESDDGSVEETSALGQWGRIFIEGGKRMNRSFEVVDHDVQRTAMAAAGFVDIQTWDFKCPVGGWPEDPKLNRIGLFSQLALESDIEGYVLFITNVISGWSREQVLVYIARLRRELRDKRYHGYFRLRAVWGRKPEAK
ncbi:methyltransferase [Diplogelasinospora grovesii]|uniref:Methyltransferase n=1 Tax=Diplogelasinospora grovesii TaxID=303347 RepID=A0AAN6NFT7_9PEZI|nr:methyltransferase [Diplogelasinospora grovesii]